MGYWGKPDQIYFSPPSFHIVFYGVAVASERLHSVKDGLGACFYRCDFCHVCFCPAGLPFVVEPCGFVVEQLCGFDFCLGFCKRKLQRLVGTYGNTKNVPLLACSTAFLIDRIPIPPAAAEKDILSGFKVSRIRYQPLSFSPNRFSLGILRSFR